MSRAWQNEQFGMCAQQTDQCGHPLSLIRVFAVLMTQPFSRGQRWLIWSVLVDAQVNLSCSWGHMSNCWLWYAEAQIIVKVVHDIDQGISHYTNRNYIDAHTWKRFWQRNNRYFPLQNSVHRQSNQYQPSSPFYVSYIAYFKHKNLPLTLASKIRFPTDKSDFFLILHPCPCPDVYLCSIFQAFYRSLRGFFWDTINVQIVSSFNLGVGGGAGSGFLLGSGLKRFVQVLGAIFFFFFFFWFNITYYNTRSMQTSTVLSVYQFFFFFVFFFCFFFLYSSTINNRKTNRYHAYTCNVYLPYREACVR